MKCRAVVGFLAKLILAIAIDFVILIGFLFCYWYYFTYDGLNYRVNKIYHSLLVKTGQTQEELPLELRDEPIDNAYNDGTKIVIYTGLINHMVSDDEIALVLGHEIAHGMLWHLRMNLEKLDPSDIQVLEANADKLGALYMMKAGYNICKGRQIYKYWEDNNGNYLGGDHPNYAYRYAELNINCE